MRSTDGDVAVDHSLLVCWSLIHLGYSSHDNLTSQASKNLVITLVIIEEGMQLHESLLYCVDRFSHGCDFCFGGWKGMAHNDEGLEEEKKVKDALHIDCSTKLHFLVRIVTVVSADLDAIRWEQRTLVFLTSQSLPDLWITLITKQGKLPWSRESKYLTADQPDFKSQRMTTWPC